ncbi:hypothetical protein BASA60_000632 [Batrachochytrium salamandrivorans]|nr:hypothetical protein BASA60_000632 [Batrachochytrium salamandrivorans]
MKLTSCDQTRAVLRLSVVSGCPPIQHAFLQAYRCGQVCVIWSACHCFAWLRGGSCPIALSNAYRLSKNYFAGGVDHAVVWPIHGARHVYGAVATGAAPRKAVVNDERLLLISHCPI